MWEFEIYNQKTQETRIIFGYWFSDAMKKWKVENPEDWTCLHSEYVD